MKKNAQNSHCMMGLHQQLVIDVVMTGKFFRKLFRLLDASEKPEECGSNQMRVVSDRIRLSWI